MGSGNIKTIIMQYLALRWFTLSCFDKEKLKIFHSLERSIKSAGKKEKYLCWHKQTENYLKRELQNLLSMNTMTKNKLQIFETNLQKFLEQNKLNKNLFLENMNFLQQCDKIICHKNHTIKKASDTITSLP